MSDFDPTERRSAIWSTEAAAACGVSSKMTPAHLWAIKTTEAAEESAADLPAQLGLACQDGIARIHVNETGHDLLSLNNLSLRADVGHPVGSHFDYLNKTTRMLHEVKFFHLSRLREFGPEGSDNLPADVLIQCLHEMLLWNATETGYGKVNGVEVDVIFGNVQRMVFIVPYDKEAEEKLIEREGEFWRRVIENDPPEPQQLEDAQRVWRKTDGSEVTADQQMIYAVGALSGIKDQIKKLDAQRDEIEFFLKKGMQAADVLRSPEGKILATWKASAGAQRIDTKKLRASYPQIAADCTVLGEPVRRFLLKGQ